MLKITIRNPWGNAIKTLIHLAVSLVRSKLTFGQEIYFSTPKSNLKKRQSLNTEANKLALGIPAHATTSGAYREAGILLLDEIYGNLQQLKTLLEVLPLQFTQITRLS